jgi:hypothetical protein
MKNFDVEKYATLVQNVLNKLNNRKGEVIAWAEFAKTNKISGSFGTALLRIGLIEKVEKNKYRTTANVYYVTRKHAVYIANVINDSNILSNLKNDTVLVSAKDTLMKMGIVKTPKAAKAPKATKKAKGVQPMQPMQSMQPALPIQPVQAPQPAQVIQAAQPAQAPPPIIVAKATPNQLPDLHHYSTQAILQEIGKRINK